MFFFVRVSLYSCVCFSLHVPNSLISSIHIHTPLCDWFTHISPRLHIRNFYHTLPYNLLMLFTVCTWIIYHWLGGLKGMSIHKRA